MGSPQSERMGSPEADHAGPRSILVTGADGFVGRHLLARLARDLPQAVVHAGFFDVCEDDAVQAAVQAARPDVVVHLAAVSAIPAAQDAPELAWRVNLGGTLALARAVLRHAPGAGFLFAGSADAYGASFRPGTPLDETAALAPLNTYAATKAAADLALGAMVQEGLRAVRLRPFNHTGPGQSDAFVLPAFARQIALIAAGRQEPVLRVGSLDAVRDFLDVRDVCAAYVACAVRARAIEPGSVLNLASGVPRRIGDILEAMLRVAGVTASIETDRARLRRADIARACGDAGRARALLGWEPAISWQSTLEEVIADWKARI